MVVERVTTRRALAGDLDAVADLFLACWRGPYASFLPPDIIARFDATTARELWARHLHPSVAPGLLVAERAGELIGVALTQIPAAPGLPAYLASLYVDPLAQGSGVGQVLFEAARRLAAGAGRRTLRWWVFADNAAALAFYRRQGGTLTGIRRIGPDYGQAEVEMAVPTTPATPT